MAQQSNTQDLSVRPGIYSYDYYSGSQCAIYFGSILIDEITSIAFQVQQSKQPLYGYADQYYRTVSKGQVLVQGSFTINFKEAGYIWLALNEYKRLQGKSTHLQPFLDTDEIRKNNVEKIIQFNDTEDKYFIKARNQAIASMGETFTLEQSQNSLTGYPGGNNGNLSNSQDIFRTFEDAIWDTDKTVNIGGEVNVTNNRRPDDSFLNGFDIYLSFGDFIGDDTLNHTIRKIENVHILNWGQEIAVAPNPIQESYTFLARNII